MRRLQIRFLALAGTMLAIAAVTPVHAQDSDDVKRAVARISLMDGQVSVRRGDSGDWVAGVINAPLMAEDHIATGPNSRAEIQFDASHMLRLGGNAELRLTDLEYGRFQMELAKGTLTYRVIRASQSNAEVDTPTVSVRPSRVGVYRISVGEGGETEVTARAGDVEVFTPRGSQWVNAGQTMMARGTTADPEFQIVSAIPVDDWDHWNDSRDRIFLQPSPSVQYTDPVNTGVYGTEDLDNYGTWTTVPDYGPVWRPTAVGVGWSPYGNGRWVWNDWYGWTFVSYDPWGWAPFHYGRWFNDVRFGWCWYPGLHVRHYWSPALVAWFGYGGGVGFGFGFGNVGWVPLAPYEVFHPWWGRGFYGRDNFYRNVHITNVNIYSSYRNARVVGGVSGMAAADFRSGRFSSVGRVPGDQLRTAGLVRGAMPVTPTSASLHYSDRQAAFTPRASNNTRFFTHQQPSAPQRTPFAQQQRAMESAGGRPAAAAPQAQMQSPNRAGGAVMPQRQVAPNVAAQAPSRQGSPAMENTRPNGAGNSGWRRFGEPSGAGAAPQASAPRAAAPRNDTNSFRGSSPNPSVQNTRPQQGSAGWQRFGNPGAPQQYNAPRSQPSYSQPRYSAPPQQYSAPRSQPSYSQPRYSAPPQQYSAPRSQPSYSAPRSAPAPSYSAPRSAPSYSAPRSAPSGGGSRPSGGGGGGGHASSGGGGGHHR